MSLLCCFGIYQLARDEFHPTKGKRPFKKKMKNAGPDPLPEERPRSLSISASIPQEPAEPAAKAPSKKSRVRMRRTISLQKRQTSMQDQCGLFTKLPFEIREMIWSYAIGGRRLHIYEAEKQRLGFVVCPRIDDKCGYGLTESEIRPPRCMWAAGITTKTSQWERILGPRGERFLLPCPGDGSEQKGLLSLLKTCRAIYTEALPFLYRDNTFCFDRLPKVKLFTDSILPSRRGLLRYLEIESAHGSSDVEGEYHEGDAWRSFWAAVAALDGLQDLRVAIRISTAYCFPGIDPDVEQEILEPLMQIKKPTNFRVRVAWFPLVAETDKGKYPFKIRRVR